MRGNLLGGISKLSKNVLIWIPLSPLHNWVGEGIAQTLENILLEAEESIKFTILVNEAHYWDLVDSLTHKKNVSVIPLSILWLIFKKGVKKSYKVYSEGTLPDKKSIEVSFKDKFIALLKKLGFNFSFANLGKMTMYAIRLRIFTIIQNITNFTKADLIWLPIPIIPWSENLKGKKVQSFWDPFVFEYSEFKDYSNFLFKKYVKLFRNVDKIITQSYINKQFLIEVFGLNSKVVEVIPNGSPDYSIYKITSGSENKKELIEKWQKRRIVYKNKEELINKLHQEILNKSRLFRLKNRITENSKIFLISTQYRVYKGFEILFRIIERLILKNPDYLFIFTSNIPEKIKDDFRHIIENIFEITRVSKKQHALLYQLADLVLHPSYSEGGIGCYPQFEAATLGRACLINKGRHTEEACLRFGGNFEKITADFRDIKYTIKKIENLLNDPGQAKENIEITLNAFIKWKEAANKYIQIFREIIEK